MSFAACGGSRRAPSLVSPIPEELELVSLLFLLCSSSQKDSEEVRDSGIDPVEVLGDVEQSEWSFYEFGIRLHTTLLCFLIYGMIPFGPIELFLVIMLPRAILSAAVAFALKAVD